MFLKGATNENIIHYPQCWHRVIVLIFAFSNIHRNTGGDTVSTYVEFEAEIGSNTFDIYADIQQDHLAMNDDLPPEGPYVTQLVTSFAGKELDMSEFIVFHDGHQIPASDYLEELAIEAFERSN